MGSEWKEFELSALLLLFILEVHPLGDLLAVAVPDALAQLVCADPRRVQHLGRELALPADELALDLPEAGDRQRWKRARQVAADDVAA